MHRRCTTSEPQHATEDGRHSEDILPQQAGVCHRWFEVALAELGLAPVDQRVGSPETEDVGCHTRHKAGDSLPDLPVTLQSSRGIIRFRPLQTGPLGVTNPQPSSFRLRRPETSRDIMCSVKIEWLRVLGQPILQMSAADPHTMPSDQRDAVGPVKSTPSHRMKTVQVSKGVVSFLRKLLLVRADGS